jgi:hypothetical protein
LAVVKLPLVPQQDHGKTKNHPKDGATDIVHGVFFEEVGENKAENKRGA